MRPKTTEEKRLPLFDKTKAKISQQIDDRVTSPVRTAIVISAAAFIMAVIALILGVKRAG